MTELLKKLNLKAQSPIGLFHAPDSFRGELAQAGALTEVHTVPDARVRYSFTLTFAGSQAELADRARVLVDKTTPEAILWFAYPKLTSELNKKDLNRDIVCQVLASMVLVPNRQVAIDADWSALRFKKT